MIGSARRSPRSSRNFMSGARATVTPMAVKQQVDKARCIAPSSHFWIPRHVRKASADREQRATSDAQSFFHETKACRYDRQASEF
jgi:hypothetical protein